MPRILLNLTADSRRRVFTDTDGERLATMGEIVTFDPKIAAPEKFAELLAHADALLTCWGSRPLTANDTVLRGNSPLLVAHAAGSVRGVVPKELLADGALRLTQGAPAIAVAVAHYTVGLMLMALRQSFYRNSQMRAGEKANGGMYRDLEGLTVGIVGLSRVGMLVVPLLKPFGCKVIAYDPFVSPEKAAALGVERITDLDDLLTRADVVSLHTPVTPQTTNILDERRVGLLQSGSVVINTARAQLVDQDALFGRAMTGEIEVYVDVTTPEPLPADHPAWQSGHIFITPHIAGPTQQTLRRMATYAIDEIERFLTGQPLQYEVTFDRYDLLA